MVPPASEDWTANPAIQSWLTTPTDEQTPAADSSEDHFDYRDEVDTAPHPAPDDVSGYAQSQAPTDVWAAAAPPETDQTWPAAAHTPPIAYEAEGHYVTYPHPPVQKSPTSRVRGALRSATSKRSALIAAGLVVVAAAVIGAGFAVSGSGSDTPAPAGEGIAIPSGAPSAAPGPVASDADCPNRTEGATTTGRDAGDTASGPGVIKAFNFGYYVERSGAKARAVVTPTGKPGSAEQMQAGIDRLDPQTLHCLAITDKGTGLYAVKLTEIPPRGDAPVDIHELVQTTTTGGKTWIVSITKDPAFPD